MEGDIERIDWDKLKVFRIVAELGSMNAAAARLGESAPTISRKIDELERTLNAILLNRSPRGAHLTEAGKKAVRYVDAMADAADRVSAEVSDFDQQAEGRVTVATGDGIGAHWIAPRLPKFHLANPKIELRLRVVDKTPDLLNGEADIAIQFSEPAKHELVARRLGVLHYMFFASPEYLKAYGQPESMFDLSNHRLLFHEGYVQQVDRWAPKTSAFRELLDLALVTNSGAVMMAVCANGGGIAVLPSYVAHLNANLVPLNLAEVAPVQFWMTYTEKIRRLSRGQLVLEWLRQTFDPRTHECFRDTFVHPSSRDWCPSPTSSGSKINVKSESTAPEHALS